MDDLLVARYDWNKFILINSPITSGLSSYLPSLNLVLSNKAVKLVLPVSELLRIYNTSQGERYYFISRWTIVTRQ